MRPPSGAELWRQILDVRLLDVHTALPCKVVSFDATAQTVTVQPLIKNVIASPDGTEIEETYPQIQNVPVIFPRSGAYFVAFPLAADDVVTVVFNEWSIDRYLDSGKEGHPVDLQRHAFNGAVAFPGGPYSTSAPVGETIDGLILGKDGGALIHIKDDLVHLGAASGAEFVALAQKVLTELQAVQTDQTTLKALLVSHVHPGVLVGGASTAVSPAFAGYVPHTPAAVAATKVKAT